MKTLITLFFLFCGSIFCFAQTDSTQTDTTNHSVLRIFLLCDECDQTYMRQELPYLNYVRDRKLAQVQIIVTNQYTASGGSEYTLQFMGLNEFSGMNDTLKFTLLPNFATDDFRTKINQYTLLGLTRYIAKTPYAEEWMVQYLGETDNQEIKDKWNFWVFNLSANGWFNGEAYYRTMNIYGSVSARRITNENKIEFFFNNNYNQNNYRINDSTEVQALFRSYYGTGSYVHSINDHWSAGTEVEYTSSIFNNMKFSLFSSFLLEYNIFPYSESTRKQFRFYYKAGPRWDTYYDTTVLNVTKMLWGSQEIGMYVELVKEWGTLSTWASYENFINNFKLYSVNIWSEASFNLFKGFQLSVSGSISWIQNQVTLLREEASNNDILLRQVQLPTDFRYFTSIGISYTFGSIYNNIVNPRLD